MKSSPSVDRDFAIDLDAVSGGSWRSAWNGAVAGAGGGYLTGALAGGHVPGLVGAGIGGVTGLVLGAYNDNFESARNFEAAASYGAVGGVAAGAVIFGVGGAALAGPGGLVAGAGGALVGGFATGPLGGLAATAVFGSHGSEKLAALQPPDLSPSEGEQNIVATADLGMQLPPLPEVDAYAWRAGPSSNEPPSAEEARVAANELQPVSPSADVFVASEEVNGSDGLPTS